MQRTTSDKSWKNHENRSTFFSRGERFKSFFISQYIAPNKTVKQTPRRQSISFVTILSCCFVGKGDRAIQFVEVTERDPWFVEGLRYTGEQIKGACLVPKRAMDVMQCEVSFNPGLCIRIRIHFPSWIRIQEGNI